MDSDLVVFCAFVKTLVVDQVPAAVAVDQCGIVPCGTVAALSFKRIVADQLDPVFIVVHAVVCRVSSCCVCVWAVNMLGAEQAHIVAAFSLQRAVSLIQIIIACFFVVENVRAFPGLVVCACDMAAVIAVDKVAACLVGGILARIKRPSSLRVDFQQKQAA